MSLRLMAWNVERFGINKLGTNAFDTNASRRSYIVSSITEAKPDILVVIEVQTQGVFGTGSLASDTSGGPGALDLWKRLPGGTIDAGGVWAVVPPLVLNVPISKTGNPAYSECMAVFFRTDKLDFTGPYKWTGPESHMLAQPIAAVAAAKAYAGIWAKSLPATKPYGGAPNLDQNQLAGQPIFYSAPNAAEPIVFGIQPEENPAKRQRTTTKTTQPDIFVRNPWHTTFIENAGGPSPGRIVKLWSVHFPPHYPDCGYATAALTRIPEVVAAPADKEVRLIFGDFNVNALDPREVEAFDQLTAKKARWSFGTPTDIYRRRFAWPTTVKGVGSADVTGDGEFYGYAKKTNALDNILTAYGTNAGAATHPEVVNRVVGTPRQDIPNPPAAEYSVALNRTIPQIRALANKTAKQKQEIFQRLGNFGQIGGKRGASDHMAVAIDF